MQGVRRTVFVSGVIFVDSFEPRFECTLISSGMFCPSFLILFLILCSIGAGRDRSQPGHVGSMITPPCWAEKGKRKAE